MLPEHIWTMDLDIFQYGYHSCQFFQHFFCSWSCLLRLKFASKLQKLIICLISKSATVETLILEGPSIDMNIFTLQVDHVRKVEKEGRWSTLGYRIIVPHQYYLRSLWGTMDLCGYCERSCSCISSDSDVDKSCTRRSSTYSWS